MEFGKFMKLLTKKHKPISYGIADNTIPWEWREKLAELTRYIDYGCTFNGEGICSKSKVPKCCCTDCFRTVGHSWLFLSNYKVLSRMAKCFTEEEKNGYWRVGKGCILPRKYRSSICLEHRCSPIKNPLDVLILNLLLRSGIHFYNTRVKVFQTLNIYSSNFRHDNKGKNLTFNREIKLLYKAVQYTLDTMSDKTKKQLGIPLMKVKEK